MVIRLVLEHHTPAVYDNLRSKLHDMQDKLHAMELQYRTLELKYAAEISNNNALCDLLRSNGIPFRKVLSHDVRFGKTPIL